MSLKMIARAKPSIVQYLLLAFVFSFFIVSWSLIQVLFYDASVMFFYFMLVGSFFIGLLDHGLISKKNPCNIHKMIGWHLVALCVLSIALAWTFNRPTIPLFKSTHPPEVDATSFLLETLEISLFFVFLNALAFILVVLIFQGRFLDMKAHEHASFQLLVLSLLTCAFCSVTYYMLVNLDLASIFLLGTGLQSVILLLIGRDLQRDDATGRDWPRPDLDTVQSISPKSSSFFPNGLFAVLDASICIALALILPTFLNATIIDVATLGTTFLLAVPFLAVASILLKKIADIRISGIFSIANGLLVIYLGFNHALNHELTLILCGFILGNSLARLFLVPSLFGDEKNDARGVKSVISSLAFLIITGSLLDLNSSRFFTANRYIIPPAGIIIGIALCVIGCLLFIKFPLRGYKNGEKHERAA
nr:hypothetical protein [Candidatus Sigynarchaeota archaeon]